MLCGFLVGLVVWQNNFLLLAPSPVPVGLKVDFVNVAFLFLLFSLLCLDVQWIHKLTSKKVYSFVTNLANINLFVNWNTFTSKNDEREIWTFNIQLSFQISFRFFSFSDYSAASTIFFYWFKTNYASCERGKRFGIFEIKK